MAPGTCNGGPPGKGGAATLPDPDPETDIDGGAGSALVLTTRDDIVVINDPPVGIGIGSFFSIVVTIGWQSGAPPITLPSGPMLVTKLCIAGRSVDAAFAGFPSNSFINAK